MKPLFLKESHLGLRILLATLGVVCLIAADLRFNSLGQTRALLDTLTAPVIWVADIPSSLRVWQDTHIRARRQLLEDNERLHQENLLLQGRSLQMASVQAENTRLRGLLNSTALLRNDVLVAELIGVSPDPVRHQLVLNKGARDGVYEGQPLIDADGLMGQVIDVGEFTSRVLLLTDLTHSIPVQLNRNGIRAIAEGTGSLDALEIQHISATTDIQEGDLLVSSGLGGRFPVGYPVGEVVLVQRDPGQPFARVIARPSAALNRSRHVLLVFVGVPEEPAPAAAEF
ncbi:rod shape-determining protein MreC [Haliea sp. E1-2-M8]|uniref:rod shape-determining protein MreC n=1 Tax=Haliea sp. E1-2-M8 TaxID=3064706 RepID=UPI00271DB331|nr:rod shape-determining protein MreC [Haliea sp. E1-2-M8]MDO8861349.1 rod shape-determining protein MreC [Haliea sp. E1-2-M8]